MRTRFPRSVFKTLGCGFVVLSLEHCRGLLIGCAEKVRQFGCRRLLRRCGKTECQDNGQNHDDVSSEHQGYEQYWNQKKPVTHIGPRIDFDARFASCFEVTRGSIRPEQLLDITAVRRQADEVATTGDCELPQVTLFVGCDHRLAISICYGATRRGH